jgi:hypothetical protein
VENVRMKTPPKVGHLGERARRRSRIPRGAVGRVGDPVGVVVRIDTVLDPVAVEVRIALVDDAVTVVVEPIALFGLAE